MILYKKILFINEFISQLTKNVLPIVLDESNFGSKPLYNYGYGYIGGFVHGKFKKATGKTLCAAISPFDMEHYSLYKGGTTGEMYASFINSLLHKLKQKYPLKRFLLIMDNYSSKLIIYSSHPLLRP